MPNDADPSISYLPAGPAPLTLDVPRPRLELGGPERLRDGRSDRMKLVVAGHDLDEFAASVVLEHDEVPNQRKKTAVLANALKHDLEFGHSRPRLLLARDGPPRLEPFFAARESPNAGL